MRDSQRARLYAGEQKTRALLDGVGILGSSAGTDTKVDQGDLQSAQAYAEAALQLVGDHQDRFHLADRWTRPVEVFQHRAKHKATYYQLGARIGLTPDSWSWRGLVLTHEVAHHLTQPLLPSHGAHFAHNFVTLVGLVEGEAIAGELRDQLTVKRVVFSVAEATQRALTYARKIRSEAASATGDGANAYVRVVTHNGKSVSGWLLDVREDCIEVLNHTVPAVEVATVQQIDREYRP